MYEFHLFCSQLFTQCDIFARIRWKTPSHMMKNKTAPFSIGEFGNTRFHQVTASNKTAMQVACKRLWHNLYRFHGHWMNQIKQQTISSWNYDFFKNICLVFPPIQCFIPRILDDDEEKEKKEQNEKRISLSLLRTLLYHQNYLYIHSKYRFNSTC